MTFIENIYFDAISTCLNLAQAKLCEDFDFSLFHCKAPGKGKTQFKIKKEMHR